MIDVLSMRAHRLWFWHVSQRQILRHCCGRFSSRLVKSTTVTWLMYSLRYLRVDGEDGKTWIRPSVVNLKFNLSVRTFRSIFCHPPWQVLWFFVWLAAWGLVFSMRLEALLLGCKHRSDGASQDEQMRPVNKSQYSIQIDTMLNTFMIKSDQRFLDLRLDASHSFPREYARCRFALAKSAISGSRYCFSQSCLFTAGSPTSFQ